MRIGNVDLKRVPPGVYVLCCPACGWSSEYSWPLLLAKDLAVKHATSCASTSELKKAAAALVGEQLP
jgi:hypothetical protein